MKTVMIIEDDKGLQDIYAICFSAAGYQVIIEGDGLSGISEVIDKKPDIILLDVMMPTMDGFAFLRALHENTELHVPVVVCSNLSDKETREKALSYGAKKVLLKVNYSGKELVNEISTVLQEEEHKK